MIEPGIKLRSHETHNKPLDDASNICESSNTWTISEFLMIILRKFCDGITLHHLWDHKILFNVTTEFYTCQKFGSEIDQELEISYILTHKQFNLLAH